MSEICFMTNALQSIFGVNSDGKFYKLCRFSSLRSEQGKVVPLRWSFISELYCPLEMKWRWKLTEFLRVGVTAIPVYHSFIALTRKDWKSWQNLLDISLSSHKYCYNSLPWQLFIICHVDALQLTQLGTLTASTLTAPQKAKTER